MKDLMTVIVMLVLASLFAGAFIMILYFSAAWFENWYRPWVDGLFT
jgi:hypothetical protein